MCSLTHCLCSLLRLWPAVSHSDYVEVFQLSLVCQIKTEYLLPVLTSAICSHQPLTFGRSDRAMAPVQPSLPVTAPAARSQLLTSARNTSKARGHASVHAATAATGSISTPRTLILLPFTFHQPSLQMQKMIFDPSYTKGGIEHRKKGYASLSWWCVVWCMALNTMIRPSLLQ